jgi:hypothetical protein
MPLPVPDTKDEVRQILSPVDPPTAAFWFNNGPVVSSLEELAAALDQLERDVWAHHVNSDKNDLAYWVGDTLGDTELAKRLNRIKRLNSARGLVSDRVDELKRCL